MKLTIALLAALAPFALAGEPNTLTEAEKKDGWKLLFDGSSAKGWKNWKTKKKLQIGEDWAIEDGALVLKQKKGGDIYTARKYENFEFSVDFKTKGNSGVLFRVDPEVPGPIYKVAPEVQIERSTGKKSTDAGGLYALYDIACEGDKPMNPDGWNTIRIRMQNNKGTHWFNGTKVAEYEIGSDDWNRRMSKSKFKDWEGFAETANGHIGLQDHGAEVAFRNIKIRVLK